MQSLFEPVVMEVLGLVSQQVSAAEAKKSAVINVSIPMCVLCIADLLISMYWHSESSS